MFKRLSTVVAVLALASAAKYTGSGLTLLLPLTILLYPFALSFYFAAWLYPVALVLVAWLVWHWVRDGQLPDSFTSRMKRLREHRIFKHPVFRHPVFRYRLRIERRP
jgi:hypothetical protein